jgi:hypothetical protein
MKTNGISSLGMKYSTSELISALFLFLRSEQTTLCQILSAHTGINNNFCQEGYNVLTNVSVT